MVYNREALFTKQLFLVVKKVLKNFLKNFKKPIDKSKSLLYNRKVAGKKPAANLVIEN